MATNVVKARIGVPGPPGAGVTAAEKATFVTLGGANVFTNKQTIAKNDANAFLVENESGTDLFDVSTAPGLHRIYFPNAVNLLGYSNDYANETWNIDSGTGNAQFDGIVEGYKFTGELIYLTLPAVDGAGSVINPGVKYDFIVPYNLTALEWTLLNDVSGSISIEFWLRSYTNYPPTVTQLVSGTTGTNNPRTVSANKNRSSTLTNWTTNWVQGDVVRVNVVSATTVTRTGIALKVIKT